MNHTVLAIGPHPDDTEYYAGGLLARLVKAGARLVIVIATDGRCGSYDLDPEELARLRAREARQAAALLGAKEPVMLGYRDFELDQAPAGELRERLIRIIRQHQPTVVVSLDPTGYDPHPDHRALAQAAADAIEYAGLPLVHPEHIQSGLTPHVIPEKYYYSNDKTRANLVVEITETLDTKLAAMAAHATQVRFLVEGIYQQAQMAGLNLAQLGEAGQDHGAALALSIRQEAAQVGEQGGVTYGEAYRYERFHPLIEGLLVSETH